MTVEEESEIFLTGGTGLLGAFVVHELLSVAKVRRLALLVRCEGTRAGLDRIKGNLGKYGLWRSEFEDQIRIIPGDICKPDLGSLNPSRDFSKVQVAYHLAAEVHHGKPFDVLELSNTTSVKRLLDVSKRFGWKHIVFTSTVGVWVEDERSTIREEDKPRLDARMGYARSKSIAEQYLRDDTAVYSSVVRLPLVIGNPLYASQASYEHMLDLIIEGVFRTRKYCEGELHVVSADVAARSIVCVGQNSNAQLRTFHVVHPQPVQLEKIAGAIRMLGTPCERIDTDSWISAATTAVPLLKLYGDMSWLNRSVRYANEKLMEVDPMFGQKLEPTTLLRECLSVLKQARQHQKRSAKATKDESHESGSPLSTFLRIDDSRAQASIVDWNILGVQLKLRTADLSSGGLEGRNTYLEIDGEKLCVEFVRERQWGTTVELEFLFREQRGHKNLVEKKASYLYKNADLTGLPRGNGNFACVLEHDAAKNPACIRYVFRGKEWSSGAVLNEVVRLASFLRSKSIGPGDRVATFSRLSPQLVATWFATWWVGASIVPIVLGTNKKTLASMLGRVGAKCLFASIPSDEKDEEFLAHAYPIQTIVTYDSKESSFPEYEEVVADSCRFETPPIERRIEHEAALIFSSGTTGEPRCAIVSHGYLHLNTLPTIGVLGDEKTSRWLWMTPGGHFSGLLGAGDPFTCGKVVGLLEPTDWRPGPIWQKVIADRIDGIFAFPSTIKMMCENKSPAASQLQKVVTGGAPTTPSDWRKIESQIGSSLVVGYGSTEAGFISLSLPESRKGEKSVGRVLSSVEFQLSDRREIRVRGPGTFSGYLDEGGHSKVQNPANWISTGDVGDIDEFGQLVLTGRTDEMMISGGFNIFPAEIENVLACHQQVAAVAVVAGSESVLGQVPVAFVVHEAESLSELVTHCRENLPRYKIPQLREIDSMPLTAVGKPNKKKLRDMLAQEANVERQNLSYEDAVETSLKALGLELNDEDELWISGLDSLGVVRLVESVRNLSGFELQAASVFGVRSKRDLLDLLRERQSA